MSAFALRGTKVPTSSDYELVGQSDRISTGSSTVVSAATDYDDEKEDFLRKVEDPLERDARDAVREGIIFRKLAVVIPALATIGMNTVAILFVLGEGGGIVVLIAGGIAILLSSVVLLYEVSMPDLSSFQAEQQELHRSAVRLATEKNRLTKKQKELELKAFCLKEDERRLIAEMNDPHKGRKYLRGIVAKVKDQVSEKTEAYRQFVLTDVMNLVIRADKDESGEFDDREIKHLIRYIKALPSISVNEKKLTKAIKKERSLVSVLSLVQDLGRKDIPPKKRIFTFDEKQIELQVMAMQKKHETKTVRKSKATTEAGKEKKPTAARSLEDEIGSKKKKGTKKKGTKKTDSESKVSPTRKKKKAVTVNRGEFNPPTPERSRGNLQVDSKPPSGRKGRSKSPIRRSAPETDVARARSHSPIAKKGGKKAVLRGLSPFRIKGLIPKKKHGDPDLDSKSGFF